MAKRVNIRLTFPDLSAAYGGTPASLSGAISFSGTFQQGETPVITWATVNAGSPAGSVVNSYEILETSDDGATFSTYKSGATAQQFDALALADVGKKYLCRQRTYNACNLVDEIPQVSSALSSSVAPLAVDPPAFTSGPTLSGTVATGNTLTVTYTASGATPITPEYRHFLNDVQQTGETASTTVLPTITDGDQTFAEVRLTNAAGSTAWTPTNSLTATPFTSAQTASFDATTAAGTGGWRPQLASLAVEDLASYDGLFSGSLGSFTPSISSGRLVFTGATGAPNGAVLDCTGVSGRTYRVTIAQTTGKRFIATDSDVALSRGVAAAHNTEIVIRQNAQLSALSSDSTATSFLNATTQTLMNNAFVNPITVTGEGAHIDGEHHVHSWKSFFPSSLTIQTLRFADQKTTSSLIVLSSSSRRNRNISVIGCTGLVPYNIDNADPAGEIADWSGGFNTTGYNKARFLYVTGGYTRDMWVYDNTCRGSYLQFEINVNGALFFVGNTMLDAYFDDRKTALSPVTVGDVRARIEGGNYYGQFRSYSAAETPATEPHVDADQVASGGTGTFNVFDEARLVWHTSADPVQFRFHESRPSSAIGGFRWSIVGEVQLGRSPHGMTNGYPDHVYVRNCVVAPSPQYLSALPISDSNNNPWLGTTKSGDGGSIGTHAIVDSFMRAGPILFGNVSGATGATACDTTGCLFYDGYGSSDFAAQLYHWGDWASLPEVPTMAEGWEYASRPVPASTLAGITPYAEITIPTSGALSGYTISEALRPTPTLSSLTVTDAATAAFTVDHDLDDNAILFWSVFSAEVTDPAQIAKGLRESGGTYTGALAYGMAEAPRGTSTFTGGGTASLSAGTYWLCVAQYNGPKKTDVATVSFVVS